MQFSGWRFSISAPRWASYAYSPSSGNPSFNQPSWWLRRRIRYARPAQPSNNHKLGWLIKLERPIGIEPIISAWKADVSPTTLRTLGMHPGNRTPPVGFGIQLASLGTLAHTNFGASGRTRTYVVSVSLIYSQLPSPLGTHLHITWFRDMDSNHDTEDQNLAPYH